MNALNPDAAARLAAFVGLLLAPIPDPAQSGIARALLASRYRYAPADLGFLRRMVCASDATGDDFARLMALLHEARERAI